MAIENLSLFPFNFGYVSVKFPLRILSVPSRIFLGHGPFIQLSRLKIVGPTHIVSGSQSTAYVLGLRPIKLFYFF